MDRCMMLGIHDAGLADGGKISRFFACLATSLAFDGDFLSATAPINL